MWGGSSTTRVSAVSALLERVCVGHFPVLVWDVFFLDLPPHHPSPPRTPKPGARPECVCFSISAVKPDPPDRPDGGTKMSSFRHDVPSCFRHFPKLGRHVWQARLFQHRVHHVGRAAAVKPECMHARSPGVPGVELSCSRVRLLSGLRAARVLGFVASVVLERCENLPLNFLESLVIAVVSVRHFGYLNANKGCRYSRAASEGLFI